MLKPTLLFAILLGSCLFTTSAQARNEGSEILQSGLMSVVLSPVLSLQGKPVEASAAFGLGVGFTVVGVGKVAAEASMLTIERVSDGSRYMVKVSEAMLKELGIAVGTSIKTTAESTGYALIASGKLVAFIPNEIGMSLLHQSKISAQ
ncbi:hypothetical protein [Janthinobacterium sp. B9-8]|uniref:hypothetical protein n=1 Tax=Janthinobacterium sp. B9-8 TaxID=1236179 RepID=UPI00061D3960|nr:hypothetical protein [Janthinobacterium sp. B9-8]AMC35942.1 hypothetical protein VN23_15725 [Janthinobacterium sp. B9-8]